MFLAQLRDNHGMFDQHRIRRAFGRAAPDYAAVAALQKEVEARLLEQLDGLPLAAPPARILDLGSGPGSGARALKQRWPKAQVLAADLALPMLRQQSAGWWQLPSRRIERVCADATALPLAEASFDLIFSSLCLQWVEDLPAAIDEFRRVLRPDGLLLLSSFASDTLIELRSAFEEADPGAAHVSPFLPLQRIGDALLAAGFRDPVLHVDRFTLTYEDPRALMRELKQLGAGNALSDRRRGLTGKRRMQAMLTAYEQFRRDGRVPATYEVVYAQAYAPPPGQPRRGSGGEIATFPLERLRRRR
jgi:malonyl-CoA O-methyltransferase